MTRVKTRARSILIFSLVLLAVQAVPQNGFALPIVPTWHIYKLTSTVKGQSFTSIVPNCLPNCSFAAGVEEGDAPQRCNVATLISGSGLKGGAGRVAFEWAGWCTYPIASITIHDACITDRGRLACPGPERSNPEYIYGNYSRACNPCDGWWTLETRWTFTYNNKEERDQDPFSYANPYCYTWNHPTRAYCHTDDEAFAGQ